MAKIRASASEGSRRHLYDHRKMCPQHKVVRIQPRCALLIQRMGQAQLGISALSGPASALHPHPHLSRTSERREARAELTKLGPQGEHVRSTRTECEEEGVGRLWSTWMDVHLQVD